VDRRVRDHERRRREPGHVEEAALVQVRQVHEDPQAVARGTRARRPRSGRARVGRGAEGEGDAVAEGVGAAPDRPRERSPAR